MFLNFIIFISKSGVPCPNPLSPAPRSLRRPCMKILVLGTNRTKIAAARSMANRGNTGRKFRLALPRSDYCDHSAEMIAATPVKRAEGPKLYGFFRRP